MNKSKLPRPSLGDGASSPASASPRSRSLQRLSVFLLLFSTAFWIWALCNTITQNYFDGGVVSFATVMLSSSLVLCTLRRGDDVDGEADEAEADDSGTGTGTHAVHAAEQGSSSHHPCSKRVLLLYVLPTSSQLLVTLNYALGAGVVQHAWGKLYCAVFAAMWALLALCHLVLVRKLLAGGGGDGDGDGVGVGEQMDAAAGGGGGAVFAASIPDQMLDGNNGIIDVAETTGTITMSVMPTATPMNGNIGCIGDQQISRVQRRPSHGLAVRPKQRAGCGVGGEVTVLRQAVGIEHLAIFLRSRIRLIGCNFPGRTVYRGDVVEQVQIRWAVKFLQILSTRSFGLNDGEETRRLTDEATAVKEGG
mmetsp:Transcript_8248/g.17276  ORF Transcript_8248/g.17276 Transcript_8248/m.17276 type:complete len:363 (-) Transcript_8248:131-1219(-)